MNEHIPNEEQTKLQEGSGVSSRFICTANHGFAPYAQEELRRLFGSVKSTLLVPGEVFLATLHAEPEEVTRRLGDNPPVFLRHIQPVQFQDEGSREALDRLAVYLSRRTELSGEAIALQARKTDDSFWTESPGELRELLQAGLEGVAAEFTVQQPAWIVSVYAAGSALYAGISRPEDNLSDWNGGAIRFRREDGQISRAKFKLMEAEKEFGIDFAAFRKGLDIGAAPGGWTSFLLERGLSVTAVDPARMHDSLANHPALKVLRKNAGEVKFRENEFDLLVCDMSWNPKLMAKLVSGLLYSLVPGGTAVVTIKLLTKKPMALIKEITAMFEDERMQIQRVKQLFHNRDEVTLYMIKY
ncbi:SAM-dependent methyltransferase [Paenibacillus sp. HN-1]|uniref:SAM-dependent methyltransferase n=1 Tax=Paenibacillus TaxID=44249 RepID=UPI001CA93385|nr:MULTISPECIES: SAM-dependent methyltransferase [Paenibacillus]MBY9082050.1 SAM-dependent methyltransferase [Paenibacillus sp. CGMCC 1.18879]MBY9085792.1 SAM-dependent methyltransferase [Paenibacillus sinensis]